MSVQKPVIPDRKKFDKMNKEEKTACLRELLGHYDDKVIREVWGYEIGTWYAMLKRFGVNKKARQEGASSEGKQRPLDLDKDQGDTHNRSDSTEQGKRSARNVIDADFEVVVEKIAEKALSLPRSQALEVPLKAAAIQSGTYMNYDVKGTPETVQKRLEAIGNLLSLEEQEQDLVLKIEVYKAT